MRIHIRFIFLAILILTLFQVQFALGMACNGKISGTISYSGDLTSDIVVMAVRIPPAPDKLYYATKIPTPGPYEIADLPDGLYIVSAFMDVDDSEGPNPGEPVGLLMEFVMIEDGSEYQDADINLRELPAGTGSISGKINYAGTKMGPVKVLAIGLSYTPINYTMVDLTVDNSYTINNLMTGSYILFAYLDVNRDGLPWITEPLGFITDFITVIDGEDTPDQDITLMDAESHTGSISGKISYNGSKTGPVSVIAVAAGPTLTPYVPTVIDAADSNYQISKLAKGKYAVIAYMDVNGDSRPNATEPMGYFEDKFVYVSEGTDTPDIQITLSDPPVGKGIIKGSITCELDGLAKKNNCHKIVVQAMGISKTPLVSIKLTDYGDYELTGLSAGVYFVVAYVDENDDALFNLGEPIGLYQGNPFFLIEEFPKNNADIAIQDPTKAKGSLSGTITYNGDQNGEIHVYTLGLSYTPFESTSLEAPGDYQITDLALGVYYVMAYMDADGDGKYDIGEPLGFYTWLATVVGGIETQDVNLTLYDKGTGAISGNIIYDGDLSGKIYVGAFGLSNTPIAKISIESPGQYKLDDLSKGRFLVWAFMDVNGDKLPGLYEPFAITKNIVHVEDSLETTDIDLVLHSLYSTTNVENDVAQVAAPDEFALMQNYPNPFNSSTTIKYQLPRTADVMLRIFNMLGEEIRTIALGKQVSGVHQILWDSKDNQGKEVASGFYVYQIGSNDFVATKKLLLLR